MAHYLDARHPLIFMRVFGEHEHLCMSLINSMLPLEKPVVSIEYHPKGELMPEFAKILYGTIVNVRCTDLDGRQFVVKMQVFWSEMFTSHVSLNASKACARQLDEADEIELSQPAFALTFVTRRIFKESPERANEYFHHYKFVNIKDTEKQIKGLEFVLIELPKFKPQNRAEKKLQKLWLRFLTEINEQTEEVPQELLDNPLTREAVGYTEQAAYTKKQLFTYDQWKIDAYTEQGLIDEAREIGFAEGLAKAKAERAKLEGEAIGLEKGRAEGEAERAKLKTELESKDAELEAAQAEKKAAQTEKEAAQKLAEEQAAFIAQLQRQLGEKKA